MSLPKSILKLINEELDKVLLEQAQANADLKRKQMAAFLYYKEIVKNGFDFERQKPEVKYSTFSEYESTKSSASGKIKQFKKDNEYIGPDGTIVVQVSKASTRPGENYLYGQYQSFNFGNETTKTLNMIYDYLSPIWKAYDTERKNFQSVMELRYMPLIDAESMNSFKSFDIMDTHKIHSTTEIRSKASGKTVNGKRSSQNSQNASINSIVTSIYTPIINGKLERSSQLDARLEAVHEKAIKKFMPLTPSQISSAEKMSNIA